MSNEGRPERQQAAGAASGRDGEWVLESEPEVNRGKLRLIGRRLMKAGTIVSLLGLVACLVLAVVGSSVEDVRVQRLRLSQSFYVGVANWVLFFYNQPEGPYLGSIITLEDGQGDEHPHIEREVGFNTFGICYRYFRWPGTTWWTLRVGIPYLMAFFSVLPLFQRS